METNMHPAPETELHTHSAEEILTDTEALLREFAEDYRRMAE